MPFNGSGTYIPPAEYNPVQPGTIITSEWANHTIDDLATALGTVVTRDGQSPMYGPLKLASGAENTPSLTFNAETRTGIYRPTDETVAFTIDASEVLRITTNGLTLTGGLAASGDVSAANGAFTGDVSAGAINLTATYPEFRWINPDSDEDEKNWFMGVNGSTWQVMAYNDAADEYKQVFAVTRTGNVLETITYGDWGDAPEHSFNGQLSVSGDIWASGWLSIESGATFAGALTAGSLSGAGSGITSLNASNLSSGTVPSGRLSGTYAISISGNAATATRADDADTVDGYEASELGLLAGSNTWTGPNTFTNSNNSPTIRLHADNGSPWALDLYRDDYGIGSKVFAHDYGPGIGWTFEHAPNVPGLREDSSSGNAIVFPGRGGYGSYSWDFFGGGASTTALRLGTADGTVRTWLYASGDDYGLLSAGGSWNLQISTSAIVGHLPWSSNGAGGTSYGTRYGSLAVAGALNGWSGINFASTNTDLLVDNATCGFHRAGYGWLWKVDDGVLTVGTVPRSRLSGVGDSVDYNVSVTGSSANTLVLRDGYGYSELYYTRFTNGDSENPTIGQFLTQNTSDNYMRKSSTGHVINTIRGSAGYYDYFWSNSHPSDYYLVNNWDGTYWRITSNHGSPVRVGYADSAGSASTATSATTASYATTAGTHAYFYHSTNTNPAGTNSAWTTYPLDATGYNTISGASLSSNMATLPVGTYMFWATMMFHECQGQVRLYNATNAAVVVAGPRFDFTEDATCAGTVSMHGIFTLTGGSKSLAFQYYKNAGNLNQSDGGSHGASPILNSVMFEKIG
jgi:hypothetical protein